MTMLTNAVAAVLRKSVSAALVYATLNPADKSSLITLSNGDLTASHNDGNYHCARATVSKAAGKWYWEVTIGTMGAYAIVGIMKAAAALDSYMGFDANGWSYWSDARKFNNGSQSAYGASFTAGDVIGVALDIDAGTLTMYKNNVSQGVMYTGLTGTFFPAICLAGFSANLTVNFGATPFTYTPPAGHAGVSA